MKSIKSFGEFVNESEKINEGFLDMFKKRKKEVKQKAKGNKYNPNNIGYDHPDFEKEFTNFEKNPEAEIEEAAQQLAKLGKGVTNQLGQIIAENQHILEMLRQMDMVNGDNANEFFISQTEDFITKLEEVDSSIRNGIW